MKEIECKKIRFKFIKKCYELNPRIRIQDFERIKGSSQSKDIRHYLLHNILHQSSKSHYTLLHHDEILRYPIESDELTEIRFDLDFKGEDKEKSIKQNIYLGSKLYHTLKEKGIKATFYYSGGKGVHSSFLLSTKGLNFKTKINNIDLKQYDKEFVQGSGETIEIINKSNEERTKFKKALFKWLNLDNEVLKHLDYQMCSSKTLLTLEGAKKRNKGSKYKTLLNYDSYNYLQLQNYVLSNNNFFIDLKFFCNISELSEAQIKEIFNFVTYNTKQNKINTHSVIKNNKIIFNNISNQIEIIGKATILTLYNLYKKKVNENRNNFSYYATKVLLYKTRNKEITKDCLRTLCVMIGVDDVNGKWLSQKLESTQKYFESLENLDKFYLNYKSYFDEQEFKHNFKFYCEVLQK